MAAKTFNILVSQLVSVTFDTTKVSAEMRAEMSLYAAEMGDSPDVRIATDEEVAQFFASRFAIGDYAPGRHVLVTAWKRQTELVGD